MLIKIKKFLGNYWIFILLATIVAIIGILKFTWPKTTPEEKVLSPTPISLPTIPFSPPQIMGDSLPSDTKISIEEFNFPGEAKVYQGKQNRISSDKAKEIASSLGFTEEPQISEDVFQGKFHSWSTSENYLSIGLDSAKISYGKNLRLFSLPTNMGILPSFSEAQEIFNNFITKMRIELPLEITFQNPKFLSQKGSRLLETAQNEADFIQVGANLAINGYQILSQDPESPTIYALIGKNKEVYRFECFIPFFAFSVGESYELKSLDEIKSSILSEAKIVSLEVRGEKYVTQGLSKVNLNEIFLVYFEPSSKENLLIQPIFVLTGQGVFPTTNESVQLTIYIPAILFGDSSKSKFKQLLLDPNRHDDMKKGLVASQSKHTRIQRTRHL